MDPLSVEVVIVGAGMAGISVARCLHQNGVQDVVVLEASDRIGGRIYTTRLGFHPKSIIELGANWIHGGCSENPVYAFAHKEGLLPKNDILLTKRVGEYYTEDGTKIDQDIASRAYDIFMRIDQEASLFRRSPCAPDITLEDFFNKRFAEEVISFTPADRKMAEAIFNCMKNFIALYVGDRPEKISLGEYWRYKELPGGNVELPCGYMAIVEALAEEFPHSWVKFNNRVTSIEWNHGKDNFAIVHSDNGETYRCRFVIVTVSVGYLKLHHNTLFKPILPLAKQQAIERIGFGCIVMMFLLFEEPFWKPEDYFSVRLAFSHEDKNRPWYEYIFAFSSVYTNPNVLRCSISGPEVEQVEKLDIEEVKEELTQVLRRFTGNPSIPAPKEVQRSTWFNNPLFKGTYSYLAIGNDGTENQTFSEPLPSAEDPRLLFAGEATHPCYFSTVHGAMLSGIREAERIVNKRRQGHNRKLPD